MIFTKHRFEIWNQTQHPFKHSLADFSYVNPALPGVSNVEGAFNWILAVLYPNTKDPVATVGDLPLVGNTLNDYRVVFDDGDGKAASYRWEQREGDVTPQWYKVYDMDWGQDSILAAFENNTQDLYVWRAGRTQLDELGDPVTGLYAGQLIYGGDQANQNLTLHANSGDGVGPQTGYVQIDSQFRPTVDATFDLSSVSYRWKDAYFSGSVVINTLSLSTGSITDSTGSISFGDENLITTGNITGAVISGTELIADDTVDSVSITPGNYTDTSATISFGSSSLSTTGDLFANELTLTEGVETLVLSADVAGNGSILSTTGTISFGDENLVTTGNISGGVGTFTLLNVDNLRLDGNTLSSTDTNGNINLNPNGTGLVDVQKVMNTLDVFTTGTHSVTGILNVDNLRLDGNTISSTNANGNIILSPNGTGLVNFSANLIPTVGGAFDLGSSTFLMNDVYLSGGIHNATNEIAISTLLAFRSGVWRDLAQTTPAQDGDALFYDSVNGVWLASTPDSEVDHTTISNLTLGDAGHTQFAMLAGRAGGQTLQGGTAASENLTLESTANATKGYVFTSDIFAPDVDASFSGSWSGLDLGDATHNFRDVHTKGEFFGLRLQNVLSSSLPASSAQNIGRVVYGTDNAKAYVDTGTTFKVLGVSKFVEDQAFNGTDLTKDVDVSASIEDAREAQWQLMDNANNFEIMNVTIKVTSASNVRIETNIPLPVGSYRLIGVE